MKKLSILIAFLFCAIVSFAQSLTPVPRGNANQIDAFRGINTGLVGTLLTPNDTTNSPATPYYGAMTVLPSDRGKDTVPIWMSNGTKWIRFSGGNAFSINDTIYTRAPISVDRVTLPGHQILYLLHLDGIVSPGYVVWTGFGLNFNVTPAEYYINYRQFFSPFGLVTLATAPVADSRVDLFIVDTSAQASKLTGIAGPGAVAPQTNPSSELPLTSVTINAGDTVPSGIGLETIYNNHVAPPTEWLPTTHGSIAADFDNVVNFYIPPKATYVSVYGSGSDLTFTKGSGTDTAQTGEILRGFIYFIVPFVNQLQFQWFNGATAVSNSIAINAGYGINPNNTTAYQIFAIPLNAWNFTPASNSIFNKLVITMSGADSSGTGGFYLDYLQLQTGLLNIDPTPAPAWLLNGNFNTNPTINFIGTLDANSIRFKTNNFHSGWISTSNALDVAIGYASLPLSSIAFHDNSAFGALALQHTSTGTGNVGVGTYAATNNTTGIANVGVGVASLFTSQTGYSNTAIGTNALYNTTTGHGNSALGDSAGRGNTTGNYNIFFGYKSGITSTTASNTLFISDSTYHGYWKGLDSADGTAPNLIGIDDLGFLHRYQNSGGGGGGSGLNIYNGDSVLSSSREVGLNGFTLNIHDGNTAIFIDPTVNNESVRLRSFNNTGGGNRSRVDTYTTDVYAHTYLEALFNDGDKLAQVYAYANVDEAEIQVIADTLIINSTLSGATAGDVWTLADPTSGSGYWGAGGTVTASNGLTKSVNDIQLGGTLTSSTTIAKANHDLTINGRGNIDLKATEATSGARSAELTINSDNGSNPIIEAILTNAADGTNGDFLFQGGGLSFSMADVPSQRTESVNMSSGQISLNFANSTTGTIAGFTSFINAGDHPAISLSSQNTGASNLQSSEFITDTAINITSDLYRITSYTGGINTLRTYNTGQLQFNQYGSGTFSGVPTFGSGFDAGGNLIETGPFGSYIHSIFTPSTGNTITALNNKYNIVNPAGALLALTVNLPSSPNNNDVVILKYTKAITTVTYANGTVVDGITSPIAGGFLILVFDSGTSSWY